MFFYLRKLFQKLLNSEIYLDYASTTPMDRRVFSVMKNVIQNTYGNPGGLYALATATARTVDTARQNVAKILGTTSEHIIFTRGGTESNNLAILGAVKKFRKQFPEIIPHIITSVIEHDSVWQVVKNLELEGEVTASYIPCNTEGIIDANEVKKELRPETILVSIMYANNEIGTIQPIREVAKLLRWWKKQNTTSLFSVKNNAYPLLHTDAIQAVNYCDINSLRLGVDFMTISGSKIYGPKSVGILFAKDTDLLEPVIYGGGHEFGLRSGTEDAAIIAGFAKALEITESIKESEVERLTGLRNELATELLKDSRITLNGSSDERLPNNINISINGFKAEELVIQLSACGFAVSAKSACQTDSGDESHVIAALRSAQGIVSNPEQGSLRITLGRGTTRRNIQKFLKELRKILEKA